VWEEGGHIFPLLLTSIIYEVECSFYAPVAHSGGVEAPDTHFVGG